MNGGAYSTDERTGAQRLLVVDDHAYFRQMLTAFLSEVPAVSVVGEAADGLEAEAMASELLPDLIVMDIRMPRQNGIDAARCIRSSHPAVKIILYSLYDYELMSMETPAAADRFIPKQKLFEELVPCIEAVCKCHPQKRRDVSWQHNGSSK